MNTNKMYPRLGDSLSRIVLPIALVLLSGCQGFLVPDKGKEGVIVFGASAAYQSDYRTRGSDSGTRTEYTGLDGDGRPLSSSSTMERISWLSTDQVTILCQQAAEDKMAQYRVIPDDFSGNRHLASVEPVDGELVWGTGTHYFFGMYPSPAMAGAPSDLILTSTDGGTTARINGSLPSAQSFTRVGNELKPDMAYAFMYAATTATGGDVNLSFSPLVTTLRFTLTSKSAFPSSGLTLRRITLKSTQADSFLAGAFTVTIGSDGAARLSSVINGSNEIYLDIPEGVVLSTTDPLMFTFLTLPMDQSELSLMLSFSDGSVRTLALKQAGVDITVEATKKCYINDIGLPWKYSLEATPLQTFPHAGDARNYSVTSYRTISGSGTVKQPVPWTITRYSVDEGATWSSECPDWLSFPAGQTTGVGSGDGESKWLSAVANTTSTTRVWHGPTEPQYGNATRDAAIDLATLNVKGERIPMTTANCYVVGSPGWFLLDCIYGNSLKGGQTNTAAFQTGNTGSDMLADLIRGDGVAIANGSPIPYVRDAIKGQHFGAILCWKDCSTTINISVDSDSGGWGILLEVGSDIEEGNAVVALLDVDAPANKKVLWSWHLWFMEPQRFSTHRLGSNEVMNMNLGWYDSPGGPRPREAWAEVTQEESGETAIVKFFQDANAPLGGNVYYQWGRKDPMLGFDFNADGSTTQRTQTGDLPWEISGYLDEKEDRPLQYGIQMPNRFFTPYSFSWYHTHSNTTGYQNLWNGNAVFATDNDVVKTVYDPCPAGYKVANYGAFANLMTYGELPKSSFGRTFKTSATDSEGIFFPGTGLLDAYGGLSNTGASFTWTAGYLTNAGGTFKEGSYLQLNAGGGWAPYGNWAYDANAMSVRCVLEDPASTQRTFVGEDSHPVNE